MATTRRRTKPKLAPGSLRVQAWLHSAIWPLREALARELHLLEHGHLTWSASLQTLAGFRPARVQLSRASRVNLDDLIAIRAPELVEAIEAQEQAIAGAVRAAAVAQAQLMAGEIQGALDRSRQRKRIEERFVPDLAEEVINRTVGHKVGIERSVIDAIRPFLEAIPRTGALAAVDAAHAELVGATQRLASALDALRGALCDAYDLPPAPIVEPAPHR
ncbi:MAG: hypothetical protein JNK64_03945 [Myxococcales bacterium]|nr:hypothetical protein [Myxococcales bacterium]